MTTCYEKGNWEVDINQKHPLEEGIKLREDVNLLSQNEETNYSIVSKKGRRRRGQSSQLSRKREIRKRLILKETLILNELSPKRGDNEKVNLELGRLILKKSPKERC